MILRELFERIEYECLNGDLDREFTRVVYDSRKIEKGCVFICVKGANFDGHSAIPEAIEKGAACIVVERTVDNAGDTVVVKVDNTRLAMAYIAAKVNDYPAEKLKMVGITGTKGKTTTTYLIKSILENAGYKVGLIGTIEIIIGDEHIKAVNTTPESYVLQDYLRKMVEAGIEIVVMEVSSQALMLHRTRGIDFDLGIFTNLEQDHIGPNEHDSFEQYMYCKSLLFKQCKLGIINSDDGHLEGILKNHTCKVTTFGIDKPADVRATDIKLIDGGGYLGVKFRTILDEDTDVEIRTPGKFSVYNALCAISVCKYFAIKQDAILLALKEACVKGRIEMLKVSKDYTLMIDYAHNAMALKSLLGTLREYNPKRLICLFGCGGNRSKDRRFEMGEVSGKYADFTIITSDNPRNEEPLDIINDIKTGIAGTEGKYVAIPDRREAIKYAIDNALPGDVIVLAGKGHEDYQEIKGVKYPMDEREIVKEIVKNID